MNLDLRRVAGHDPDQVGGTGEDNHVFAAVIWKDETVTVCPLVIVPFT